MSKQTETSFNTIRDSYKAYTAAVSNALRTYRQNKEHASHRYTEAVAAQKIADHKATANAEIMAANSKLRAEVRLELDELRKEMHKSIVAPLPDGFVDTLRAYKDFGVSMSKTELLRFLEMAQGNYPALRILKSVAEHNGYKLTFPAVEDFEKDLKRLIPREPEPYAGDYINEALEFFPKRWSYNDDGKAISVWSNSDSTSLIISTASIDSKIKDIAEIAARWDASFIGSLEEMREAVAAKLPDLPEEDAQELAGMLHEEASATAATLKDDPSARKTANSSRDDQICRDIISKYL